jgi:uroporphyrinogen III methyltransferase/synthase
MKRAPRKPLQGLKIVVTRPRDQAAEMIARLEKLGAEAVSIPAIRIRPLRPNPELDRAIAKLDKYRYLVFTSRNGVEIFFEELKQKGLDRRALRHLKVACIGPATAQALKGQGVKCGIQPRSFVAEALLEAFPRDLKGKRVLMPRAKEAREVLPAGLRGRGAKVDVIPVYESVPMRPAPRVPRDTDIVIFTSGSTVINFMGKAKIPKRTKIACIGPITKAEVEKRGRKADIVAEKFTAQGLVNAIKKYIAATGAVAGNPGGKRA